MSLLAMQRDFRDWLRHDDADAAKRLGGGALAGLAIYQNNYRSQLMECLASACEQVRRWIGDDAFFAAAATHIDRLQPSGWTLDAYPDGFADTLVDMYPDSPEIAELAWLEIALAQAFVAQDCLSFNTAELAGLSWDAAVLRMSPSVRMRDLRTNAPAIWSALSTGEERPQATPLPRARTILIWRAGYTTRFRTMDAGEAASLAATADGQSFNTICNALVAQLGEQQGVALAGEMLGRWLSDGVVVGVR